MHSSESVKSRSGVFDERSYVAAEAQRTMIVYGDPQFTTTPAALLAQLRERLARATSLDEFRAALILAGQLEQGLADTFPSPQIVAAAQRMTDDLANAFRKRFLGDGSTHPFASIEKISAALGDELHTRVNVKVPEGFAFYSLFPEQYVVTAERWAAERVNASPKRVIVVGLRSIGTSLSAVVATALANRNWRVERVTVRPTGHPFDRRVELPSVSAEFAIVVDEGPGLSGSSMAATAEALMRAGVARERIAFFPAHDNEPGHAATVRVRRWWRKIPRYTTDLTALRWIGRSLHEWLAERSAALVGSEAVGIEDASGGLWRRFVYANESEWPAANIAFERAKFLVKLKNGRGVLWKFSGMIPSVEDRRSACTIQPLGTLNGFTASPWIEGQRLRVGDLDDLMLEQIAEHILSVSGEELSSGTGFEQLAEMLVCNSTEALGEEGRRASERLLCDAEKAARDGMYRAYGDGRLAPHEFVRDALGRIHKTDCGGHDRDHTMVRAQPILWDFAGTAVEWNLNADQLDAMLEHARSEAPRVLMDFYRAAYAAFRLGMFVISPGNAAEVSRSCAAQEFYRQALARTLTQTGLAPRIAWACE